MWQCTVKKYYAHNSLLFVSLLFVLNAKHSTKSQKCSSKGYRWLFVLKCFINKQKIKNKTIVTINNWYTKKNKRLKSSDQLTNLKAFIFMLYTAAHAAAKSRRWGNQDTKVIW